MTETQLITNVLDGNRNDFAPLVERYLPMVRALCRSHVYDPAAEEDLVQDSLLEGYRKLPTLRNPERFGPWLAAITRNKCKNWLRGQSRRAKAYKAVADEVPAPAEPMGLIARKELYQWVHEQIAGLPDKTREAMLLHYVEGKTIAESAAFLGISETAVKQRLFYGRQRIGTHLWGELGEKSEQAGDTATLRERVLAGVAHVQPVKTTGPLPIAATLSLGALAAAAMLAVGFFATLPAKTAMTPDVEEQPGPRVRFVMPDTGGIEPGTAPLAGIPVRIAPQQFNRDAFETLLQENNIDPALWDALAEQFTNTPGWTDFMSNDTLPPELRENAFIALERMAMMVEFIPRDAAMQTYESVLPEPAEGDWRELETGPDGYLDLSTLEPGIWVLRAGEPVGDPPPWSDLNRHRLRIESDTDATITLPPPR